MERRYVRYESSAEPNINRYRKNPDVPMKSLIFSGQALIAVLGFLESVNIACDHNGITKGATLWCFQFYLTGQAHALLQSRINLNIMAVDLEQSEMLRTCPEVVNFLLRTYAADEVIYEAVGDLTSFCQSFNMTEEVYNNQIWDKSLPCGTARRG